MMQYIYLWIPGISRVYKLNKYSQFVLRLTCLLLETLPCAFVSYRSMDGAMTPLADIEGQHA